MEAFNDAGHSGEPLVVVLNDNEMSIDRNEGALARYLTRLRARPGYQRAKRRTKSALDSLPLLGRPIKAAIQWSQAQAPPPAGGGGVFRGSGLFLSGSRGRTRPADAGGRAAGGQGDGAWPVLLHVLTTKGKGFEPAQVRPGTLPRRVPQRRAQGLLLCRRRGRNPLPAGREGQAALRHHRRHARGHRDGALRPALSGTLLRCGHRRIPRRHHGRGHGGGRPASPFRGVFHLFAARV